MKLRKLQLHQLHHTPSPRSSASPPNYPPIHPETLPRQNVNHCNHSTCVKWDGQCRILCPNEKIYRFRTVNCTEQFRNPTRGRAVRAAIHGSGWHSNLLENKLLAPSQGPWTRGRGLPLEGRAWLLPGSALIATLVRPCSRWLHLCHCLSLGKKSRQNTRALPSKREAPRGNCILQKGEKVRMTYEGMLQAGHLLPSSTPLLSKHWDAHIHHPLIQR